MRLSYGECQSAQPSDYLRESASICGYIVFSKIIFSSTTFFPKPPLRPTHLADKPPQELSPRHPTPPAPLVGPAAQGGCLFSPAEPIDRFQVSHPPTRSSRCDDCWNKQGIARVALLTRGARPPRASNRHEISIPPKRTPRGGLACSSGCSGGQLVSRRTPVDDASGTRSARIPFPNPDQVLGTALSRPRAGTSPHGSHGTGRAEVV